MERLDDILGSIARIIGFICLFFIPFVGVFTYFLIVEAIDDKIDYHLFNVKSLLYIIFGSITIVFHSVYLWLVLPW